MVFLYYYRPSVTYAFCVCFILYYVCFALYSCCLILVEAHFACLTEHREFVSFPALTIWKARDLSQCLLMSRPMCLPCALCVHGCFNRSSLIVCYRLFSITSKVSWLFYYILSLYESMVFTKGVALVRYYNCSNFTVEIVVAPGLRKFYLCNGNLKILRLWILQHELTKFFSGFFSHFITVVTS